LFDLLAERPASAIDLSSRLSLPVGSTTLLLDAAVSLKLAQRRSRDRYGLGPLGAALLGNPGVIAMIEHHAMLYGDLRDPVSLLRGEQEAGELASYWPYARGPKPAALAHDAIAPYTALMSASQPMIAQQVLHAYSFRTHRCLLDVGGGDGSFLIAAGRQTPGLKLMLFDLPGVAGIARDRFASEKLGRPASVTEGNFLADALPQGADVVSLIRVVHDHDDDAVLNLFARVREALPKQGVLVIGEPISGLSGVDSVSAYFNVYLHAMGSGRPRSFAALQKLLQQSGFAQIHLRATRIPMIASVVIARS
jgi:demethylspheroidene O-methyltransferase